MEASLKPYTLKYLPADMARADRIARLIPQFEGKRSPVVRQALREFLDRKEREIAEADEPIESRAA